jgi:hypothetical protein
MAADKVVKEPTPRDGQINRRQTDDGIVGQSVIGSATFFDLDGNRWREWELSDGTIVQMLAIGPMLVWPKGVKRG